MIEYGVCKLSIAPLRKKPDDRSEMVSQMLFGETVQLLKREKDNWYSVLTTFDDYPGYVDPKMFHWITEQEYRALQPCTKFVMQTGFASNSEEDSIHLTTGANLPGFDGLSFKMPFGKFRFADQIIDLETLNRTGETVEKIARKYLNAPYLWGGRSPFGIDCSGFTQVVFKMIGIRIPRDATYQARMGDSVAFLENIKTGDLAYFVNETNRIIHVGIITGDKKIIHASGKVRIDQFDRKGIYNEDLGKYTHNLRLIKRVVGARRIKSYLF